MVRSCFYPLGEKETHVAQNASSGGCQKRLDSGCFLQAELTDLLEELDVEGWSNRGGKVFFLMLISWIEKDGEGRGKGRILVLVVSSRC